jgi:hypothetical protein
MATESAAHAVKMSHAAGEFARQARQRAGK